MAFTQIHLALIFWCLCKPSTEWSEPKWSEVPYFACMCIHLCENQWWIMFTEAMGNAVKIKPDLGCQPIECRPLKNVCTRSFSLAFWKDNIRFVCMCVCLRPLAPYATNWRIILAAFKSTWLVWVWNTRQKEKRSDDSTITIVILTPWNQSISSDWRA